MNEEKETKRAMAMNDFGRERILHHCLPKRALLKLETILKPIPSQFFGFAILSYLIQWIFFSSTFPLQKTLAINASI